MGAFSISFSFVKLKILVLEMILCRCSTHYLVLFAFCLSVSTDVLQGLGQLLEIKDITLY